REPEANRTRKDEEARRAEGGSPDAVPGDCLGDARTEQEDVERQAKRHHQRQPELLSDLPRSPDRRTQGGKFAVRDRQHTPASANSSHRAGAGDAQPDLRMPNARTRP